jgi:hypothetical protein
LEAVLLSAPDTAAATSCPPGQTKVGDEGGQFVKPLSEAEPGRAVVRKEESGPVRELEVGSCSGVWVIGSCRRQRRVNRLEARILLAHREVVVKNMSMKRSY